MRAVRVFTVLFISLCAFGQAQEQPGRERPRLLLSLASACWTVLDYRSTLDLASSAEIPFREGTSLFSGFRFRSHRPGNSVLDGTFRQIGLSGHLAARHYPWEWARSFFFQAGLGYGQDWGTTTLHREGGPEVGYARVPYVHHQDHRTLEAALGIGFRWHAGPLVLDARVAFGPKRIVQEEYDGMGATASAAWMESLLRFQDLEVGFSL